MANLDWTKTETGYEAKSAYGHYEALRQSSRFVLFVDGAKRAEAPTTLAQVKGWAQYADDSRHEAAEKEAAERDAQAAWETERAEREAELYADAVETARAEFVASAPVVDAESNDVPAPLDASDVITLLRPETVADVLRCEEQAYVAEMAAKRKPVPAPEKKAKALSPLAAKVAANLAPPPATTKEGSHIVIVARAGTGKTTTLIGGLRAMRGEEPLPYPPSAQQCDIFRALSHFSSARFVGLVAYNKSIADELRSRVPAGIDAMTFHSMGLKAVRKAFPFVSIDDKGELVQSHIAAILERDIRDIRREDYLLLAATSHLVELAKANLLGADGEFSFEEDMTDELDALTSHYDVELVSEDGRDYTAQVYELVPAVLRRCLDVTANRKVDFDDMVWLPVVLNLPAFRYDVLMVDESQDLNRCRQALARKCGKVLVLVGDPKQAVYGFAGADAKSMERMEKELRATPQGVSVFPLTVTYRCGKAIVEEARKIVPDFFAAEKNGEGKISQAEFRGDSKENYRPLVADGDMVLCRVNGPLVSECFRFIKAGRKANIQGRNIAEGLIALVKRLKAEDAADLVGKVSDWLADETDKENRKKFPSESRIIGLQDKADCLVCFTEGKKTVEDVLASIDAIFTNNPHCPGVRLSSIHRAKGLEAKRVFVLQPKGGTVPHPMAKSKWQQEQEMNLKYVAITRAIEELVWVYETDESRGLPAAEKGRC